jgi:hypothetical protein
MNILRLILLSVAWTLFILAISFIIMDTFIFREEARKANKNQVSLPSAFGQATRAIQPLLMLSIAFFVAAISLK